MDEKKLELYYDHYKDSFENQKIYLQRRNNYSLISLGVALIISFQISDPGDIGRISSEFIKQKIGITSIEFAYVNSFILFAFLWIVMMYFQVTLLIENNYDYIKKVEEKLSDQISPNRIYREGHNYLQSRSWFTALVRKIYTIAFPTFILLLVYIKWNSEKLIYRDNLLNGHFIFDTVIIVALVVLTILYLVKKHFNDFRKKN